MQAVDDLRRRAAEGEADEIHGVGLDHLHLGVIGVVFPARLAQRHFQSIRFRLKLLRVGGDLSGITRCRGDEEIHPEGGAGERPSGGDGGAQFVGRQIAGRHKAVPTSARHRRHQLGRRRSARHGSLDDG